MIQNSNSKPYNLDERTFQFAKEINFFCKKLSRTIENNDKKFEAEGRDCIKEADELKKIISSIIERSN